MTVVKLKPQLEDKHIWNKAEVLRSGAYYSYF